MCEQEISVSPSASRSISVMSFKHPVTEILKCTELFCKEKTHCFFCSSRGGDAGLCFLDAMLAFGGQKTRSLINCDSKLFLTVREVKVLASCWCQRAFRLGLLDLRPLVVGPPCLLLAWRPYSATK